MYGLILSNKMLNYLVSNFDISSITHFQNPQKFSQKNYEIKFYFFDTFQIL